MITILDKKNDEKHECMIYTTDQMGLNFVMNFSSVNWRIDQ